MKSVKIRLLTIVDVRDFVNIVAKSDTDIDLQSGRYVVDGKSIMGIFSLDLLSPITMTVHSEHTDALLAELYRFIIKEWKKALRSGGHMAFEVGETQAEDVKKLMLLSGFKDVDAVKDSAGIWRVVHGRI